MTFEHGARGAAWSPITSQWLGIFLFMIKQQTVESRIPSACAFFCLRPDVALRLKVKSKSLSSTGIQGFVCKAPRYISILTRHMSWNAHLKPSMKSSLVKLEPGIEPPAF